LCQSLISELHDFLWIILRSNLPWPHEKRENYGISNLIGAKQVHGKFCLTNGLVQAFKGQGILVTKINTSDWTLLYVPISILAPEFDLSIIVNYVIYETKDWREKVKKKENCLIFLNICKCPLLQNSNNGQQSIYSWILGFGI
jgi:hypothetical protein